MSLAGTPVNDRQRERPTSAGLQLQRVLGDLPVLPSVVSRLMLLDASADDFFEQLLELLESDPPFAVRCLRLANSAAHAPETPITTLVAAVSRIGGRRLVHWLTTMGVTEVFVPTTEGQRLLWHHSVQTALAARVLARTGGADVELAYLAGLLHDIGRFLMLRDAPEQLSEADAAEWNSPEVSIETERRLVGYDHAELGGRACRLWGLPPVLADVVTYHHRDLGDLRGLEPRVSRLVAAVRVADEASALLHLHGRDLLNASPMARRALLARPCSREMDAWLDLDGLEQELGNVVQESDRMMRALGITTGSAAER